MAEPSSEIPTPSEVRAQLDRMIASDEFVRSPQLGAFLRFVVDAVLQGKSDRIKAYTIGVDVLRRDAKFDPQLDPIVRVEATRLRRTIDRYYAGIGSGDPIRIGLPRGSYVPAFSRSTMSVGIPAGGLAPRLPASRRWSIHRVLTAFIAVAVIAIAATLLHRSNPAPEAQAPGAVDTARLQAEPASLPPGNGLPVLFMPPFEVSGAPGSHSISASSLHDTLSGAFTHFDLVNILLETPDRHVAGDNVVATSRDPPSDYRFSGSVEYSDDGAARLLFRLIDVADGSIVWSRVFDHVLADDDKAFAEEKIVRELAGTLLQPFGVIYARQRGKVLNGNVTDPRYRCLVDVIDSFSSFDPAQQSRGRDCLEGLTARDPNFALGFTYLAALDLREYQYGIDVRSGETPPLERGLPAARRGVELNPETSRAYEMLFVILFARGELAAAFDAANKAITLNKYDMRSLGAYGARLIASGDIYKGMTMLRQAGDDGTVRPPFEEFFLFLGDYVGNNMSDAAFHAAQITNDSFQLGLIAHALAASAKGDHDAAARALEQLVALNPAWRDDLRGTLARFFYAPAIVDRLAGDLAAAGLPSRP